MLFIGGAIIDARLFIRKLVSCGCFIILSTFVISVLIYFEAKDVVQTSYDNLCRIVSSDNCLDDTVSYDGMTNYDRYFASLKDIETAVGYVKFKDDSIGVQYTSRDDAPQQYSMIQTRLTGYYCFNINLFGEHKLEFPIEYNLPVMGTKRYRDR